MPRRLLYESFQIDTNRINSRQRLPYMNKLERWEDDGVIHIDMSLVAHREALAGADRQRGRKAHSRIYTLTYADTPPEQERLRRIERILFPSGARTANERNDIEIVFNAGKYGRILVTADGASRQQPGGILGNRTALERLGIRVMADSEAVAHVEGLIEGRDRFAREVARFTREPLPGWVGKD